MVTIKLNDDNDLDITNNEMSLVDETEEIAQMLRTRLKLYRGEWFLNTGEGVPWLQEILGKTNTKNGIESIIKDQILQTPGVKSLEEFSSEINTATRQLNVSFQVKTESDTISLEVII